jgi:NADH-quinone oxidoreductase subunit G
VDTKHPKAVQLRTAIMGAYLIKHPLDCSLCDKVDDCCLHKFASRARLYGFTRVAGKRYLQRDLRPLGKKIAIDDAKCILCGRCLKFCHDILGEEILGKIKNERGIDEIRTYPSKNCDGNYSLNLVDVCPAGAIVDIEKNHERPLWALNQTPSISPVSSVGVNTYIVHDGKHVHHIIPRRNDRVNESWMPDSSRELVSIFDPSNRITHAMRSGEKSDIKIAIAFATNKILSQSTGTCILCSGKMSLEDQFILKKFTDIIPTNVYFLKRKSDSDDFLISDDPYPNCAGAEILRLSTEKNTHEDLNQLYADVRNGVYKNIICVYENLFDENPASKIFDGVSITYIGHEKNRTSNVANFAFPVRTIFERTGTFISRDHLAQRFCKAVPPPTKNILECWEILSLIMNTYSHGDTSDYLTIDQIWKDLPQISECFAAIDFASLPSDGIFLKKS